MRTKLLPGAAARLQQLGIHVSQLGRITNKATIIAPPEGVPIPKNATEAEEILRDDNNLKKITAAGRDGLIGWANAYAQTVQGEGTDLQRKIETEAQRVFAKWLKDNDQTDIENTSVSAIKRLNFDPTSRPSGMRTSHQQGAGHNPRAVGAFLDKEWPSLENFLRATWHMNSDPEAQTQISRIKNASSSVVPAEGGFLVPEAFRAQLLQLALEESVVRPRATVVPMEVPRVQFPMIDSTTNSGSVFGGMIAYWAEESAAFTESSPKFGRITLDAKKLTGFALVPNELLRDSYTSFTALLETLWPRALAFFEDVAYMTGTGVGEPLGFLGSANPASLAVSKESGQPAGTIVVENIIKMYARMLPASLNRAVWIVSPECIPELYTMALSVGTGGAPVMLVNAAGPGPATMLGRPIVISEKAGQVGTRTDVSFVDLSYYLIGDRQMMTADQSTDYRFANDQTAFRILQRVDGRPWLQSAITPQNGGDTLSPFVELETRS